MKRQARPETARPRPTTGTRSEAPRSAEDRLGYRRSAGMMTSDKKAEAGAGSKEMEFRGGFGRGSNNLSENFNKS